MKKAEVETLTFCASRYIDFGEQEKSISLDVPCLLGTTSVASPGLREEKLISSVIKK